MDWSALPDGLTIRESLVNQSSDPRIGSGRTNSSTGTLSHVTSSGTDSSSASSLGSTFVPVLIYSAICLAIFFSLRRKNNRVYAPRTIKGMGSRSDHELTEPLPKGWVNWIKPFYKIEEAYILNHCSLDGFLFLRFVRVLAIICGTGCIIAWPVLLSVNGTGGNDLSQLDLLTIGNVSNPLKFYAHTLIAYSFFGFILFMISRECIYYVNLRQAYMMSPQHAHSLSARTVLFTCVPKRFRDEHRIRKLFGDSVKNVWIPQNTRALERLVSEREKTAVRLEKAEITLIKKANAARNKMLGNALPIPMPVSSPTTSPESSPKKPKRSATSNSGISASSASSAFSSSSCSTTFPSKAARRASAPREMAVLSEMHESTPMTLNSLKPRLHDEITPVGRHDSIAVSVATSTPSATLVGATSDSPDKMDDYKEDLAGDEKPTQANDDEKHHDNELGQEDDDEEEEENEMDYVHPYGFALNLPDVRGSVAAQWLPAEKRPGHRPLANYGRRVDTIRWTRLRLKVLNQNIARTRRRLRGGDGDALSSVFVEFESQAKAQAAFQTLTHHQPLHMSPRYIGVRPTDIIWASLRIVWWERIIRRFFILGAVTAGIIFWSVPSAFVGLVSNIDYLSENVAFLSWLTNLPSVITGVIQGLLPALALSLLMAAVPCMLRGCARFAGAPSVQHVELFTQHAYFVFQVVQVFLVTTLTSAASAAFQEILEDPLSVKDLLSKNLPKASNFYLSYITVQCLAGGAMALVHFFDLFRHGLLAKSVEHPRRSYHIWHRLKQPHWGSIYPVFTNLGVIAISYTCIAPLILVFSCIGLCVTYNVYRYNLLYTFDVDVDSKGLHYPRALMHLMVGLYVAEICLIGLFSIQTAIGPVILMVVFLIFSVLVHISLSDAVSPLLNSLPQTLALEDKDLAGNDETDAAEEAANTASSPTTGSGGLAADYYDLEEGYGAEDDDDGLHDGPVTERGIGMGTMGGLASLVGVGGVDGGNELRNMASDWVRSTLKDKFKTEKKAIKEEGEASRFAKYLPWVTQANKDGERKPNFIVRWLHPQVYQDYRYLSTMMPREAPDIPYPDDYALRGYQPPEMWKPIPRLWIPRDDAHVSRQEVDHTRKFVPITDRGSWLSPKGHVEANMDKAPFVEPRILY